jgi:hypothetical protein
MKQNDYANELNLQIAMKQNQAANAKLDDVVQDYRHLETVDNYSPYGR